eukprot:jgi/Mesen1/5012/ME000025S04413
MAAAHALSGGAIIAGTSYSSIDLRARQSSWSQAGCTGRRHKEGCQSLVDYLSPKCLQTSWQSRDVVQASSPRLFDLSAVLSSSQKVRKLSTVTNAAVQEQTAPSSQNGSLFSRILPSLPSLVIPGRKFDRHLQEVEEVEEESSMSGELVANGMIYRERFLIRCYEVGMNRTASLESIANLLQEIGCNHAQSVGFSNDGFATTPAMRKKRLIWVTTRMHIEIDRYPLWGDVVEIDTWFQGEGRIGARRDWIIRMAKTGEVIGKGTSTWVTMNKDTRRLSKIPDDVRAEYMQFCPEPPKYAISSEQPPKIRKLEEPEHTVSNLAPRRGDLDMNQHVNNVTYIGWMLESIPAQVHDLAELAKITLEYRRECSYGDVVQSSASLESHETIENTISLANGYPLLDTNGAASHGGVNGVASNFLLDAPPPQELEFTHLLGLQTDGKEINRGRTVWRIKPTCNLD